MSTNRESIIKIKTAISQPISASENIRHYVWREGFVFSKGFKDKIFDDLIVRSPSNANCDSPIYPIADKTINDYIDLINGAELELATVIAEDLSFLEKCPSLRYISIRPSDNLNGELDFAPLYNSENIKALTVRMSYGEYPNIKEVKNEIDYSKVKGLVYLRITFDSNRHKNFDKIDTLKTLSISQYPQQNLNALFSSKILDSLLIITSKITSLNGISRSQSMQCLLLYYNRSLNDISALADVKSTMRILKIENCPKISDFSVLQELTNLEVLILRGKNKISSLQFINKLKNLKVLMFDMEIEDGDLTPCLSIPFVCCEKNKKKYNLKGTDLPGKDFNIKDLKDIGMENIEFWRRIHYGW